MRAPTYHGTRDVRIDNDADPRIEDPTDAIIRVTSMRTGQADVRRWIDDIMPLVCGDQDGAFKVLVAP